MIKYSLLLLLTFELYARNNGQSFIDIKNHLEWQDSTVNEAKELKWAMSKSYCKSLTLFGHNDWRIPRIRELKTFVPLAQNRDKIHYGVASEYWTSEEYKDLSTNAWAIYMKNGHLFWNDKCETAHYRCVRSNFKK